MALFAKSLLVLTVLGLYVGWLMGLVAMNRMACKTGKMRRLIGALLFIVLGLVFGGSFVMGLIVLILHF
jgi:hypothetical protein